MEDLISIANRQLILSGQITIYCMIIPIIVGLLKWGVLDKALRIFFLFCVCNLLLNGAELLYLFAVEAYTDFFESWLAATANSLNFLLIFYQLMSFLLLGYFFGLIFAPYGYKQGIWYLSIGLSILAILAYLLEEGWKNYGTFGPASEAIFIVVLPLSYLWFLSRKALGLPLLRNPYFLICLGLALPNLVGLFLFFVGSALYEENFYLFAKLNIIKNIFMTIGLVLFAIGFWRVRTPSFKMESVDD